MLTYPRSTSVMIVGTRGEFVERFLTGWRAMGFTGPILVPNECEGLPSDLPRTWRGGAFEDLLPKAEMFIFGFGLATQRPGRANPHRTAPGRWITSASGVVTKLFRQAASTEAETRPAGRRTPRRFVGVNVIYNKFWPLFTDYVGANINPFCSQVLAGLPRLDPSLRGKVLRFRGRRAI